MDQNDNSTAERIVAKIFFINMSDSLKDHKKFRTN